MSEFLTVLGIFIIGMALRSCRHFWLRKFGAITYVATTGLAAYFISGSLTIAIASTFIWFFLPWIELLTRVRKIRIPLNNRLRRRQRPLPEYFPEAAETAAELERAGFEFIEDAGWSWGLANLDYQLYWHPEERAIAAVCLCEQNHVTFSFLSISSYDTMGHHYQSSNYPFSTTLKLYPQMFCNRLSCQTSSVDCFLVHHHEFIASQGPLIDDLKIPDPNLVISQIEEDTRKQIDFNLNAGIITICGEGQLRYTFRGLVFLWCQVLRDMIRLC